MTRLWRGLGIVMTVGGLGVITGASFWRLWVGGAFVAVGVQYIALAIAREQTKSDPTKEQHGPR